MLIIDVTISLGLRTTKGVLLHGPPGTGKTSLALSCVHDAGVNLFSVNGPEIVGQYYGESERALHEVFESACQAAPAVVRLLPAFSFFLFGFLFPDHSHSNLSTNKSKPSLCEFFEIPKFACVHTT